jgi:hypothetical protein
MKRIIAGALSLMLLGATPGLAQKILVTPGGANPSVIGAPSKFTVRAGDVVWIPAGVKHWHGATATDPMSHIALSYMRDGNNVVRLETVTDAQYTAK